LKLALIVILAISVSCGGRQVKVTGPQGGKIILEDPVVKEILRSNLPPDKKSDLVKEWFQLQEKFRTHWKEIIISITGTFVAVYAGAKVAK